MSTEITKKEIATALEAILNSTRILGNEGLAVDINDLLERVKKDL
jgi:hypothetical protein